MFETTHEMAVQQTILRGLVGSTVHGLNVEDAIEDRDEMGVCVEDVEHVVGFQRFEQVVYRTAAIREGRANARSRAGDLDLVIYSLKKYLRLALNGNPTILILLFVRPEDCIIRTETGQALQDLAPKIVSRRAGHAFLGYLQAQRQRLTGERGQKNVNRPELVEKYGFDTKYAMHMLRLGYQGVELMETGRMSLPMREPERTWLRGVREGSTTLEECLRRATELEERLRTLLETSPLPERPDRAAVEPWMVGVYMERWRQA